MENTSYAFKLGDRVFVYTSIGDKYYYGNVIGIVAPNMLPSHAQAVARIPPHLKASYRKDVRYPYETYLIHVEDTNKVTHPLNRNIGLSAEKTKPSKKNPEQKVQVKPAPLKVPCEVKKTFEIGDRAYVYNPMGDNYYGKVVGIVPPNTYPGARPITQSLPLHLKTIYKRYVLYSHVTYLVHVEGTDNVTRPRVANIELAVEQYEPVKKKPEPLKVPFEVKKTPAAKVNLVYSIKYNMSQLEMAAAFIFKNNDMISHWVEHPTTAADVQQVIVEFIRNRVRENMELIRDGMADQWNDWAGIGGYHVLMTTDDDQTVDVEIFVDPAVGGNKHKPYRTVTESFS